MTKPTIHEAEAERAVLRAWHAARIANRVGILKFRRSRKDRRRARHSQVAALGTSWRLGVYRMQNRVNGAQGTAGDGLTPAQRRRIRHKENAARSER